MWPFLGKAARSKAETLLGAVIEASRQPALFAPGRIPDTLDGRWEAVTLHACLALIRLGAAPGESALAQRFTDRLFRHIDAGLREAAVGDLSVPKRMRKLAARFYGRLEAYAAAIAADDRAALEAALARNIFPEGASAVFAGPLAAYMLETARSQADAPAVRLLLPEGWRPAPD